MKDSFIFRLALAVLFASIVVGMFYGYDQTAGKKPVQMSNPASDYCLKQGGELEIRSDAQGNQTGWCLFSNGQECEEWAFFRNECSREDQFCGSSSLASCHIDAECIPSGCSGQICQAKSEEAIITDCQYQDCFNTQKFGLSCRCFNHQCQWTK